MNEIVAGQRRSARSAPAPNAGLSASSPATPARWMSSRQTPPKRVAPYIGRSRHISSACPVGLDDSHRDQTGRAV